MISRDEIAKAWNAWPVCPITQNRIIIPAQVFYKQSPDANAETMVRYEFAAIKDYQDTAKTKSPDQPVIEPQAGKPIISIKSDIDKLYELRKLAENANTLGVIDKDTYEELIEKFSIGILHFLAIMNNTDSLLSELAGLKNKNLINSRHYVTGRTLLQELVIVTSPERGMSIGVLDILLSYRQLDVTVTDDEKITSVMQAAISGNLDAFEKLLTPENLNAKDLKGNNVLHWIVQGKNHPTAPMMFRIALDAGADILAINKDNETPLGNLIHLLSHYTPDDKKRFMQCLNYVAIKQPEKIREQHALAISLKCDNNRDLFAFCITYLHLEAARCLISAGHPSLYFKFENGEFATHVLAKKTGSRNLPLITYNDILRTIEFLMKTGLSHLLKNNDGKMAAELLYNHPLLPSFSLSIIWDVLFKEKNWAYFANQINVGITFAKTVMLDLLKAIIMHPDNHFLYKKQLRIILKSFGEKCPNVLVAQKEVAVDKFAIDSNNVFALEILCEEKMLSTSLGKLLAYAELTNAASSILNFLRTKQSDATEKLRPRRHSCSQLFVTVRDEPQNGDAKSAVQRSQSVSCGQ